MKRLLTSCLIALGLSLQLLPVHAQAPTTEVDGQKFIFKNGKTYKVSPDGSQKLVQPFGPKFTGKKKPNTPTAPTATDRGKKYVFVGGKTYQVNPDGSRTLVDFFSTPSR